MCLEFWQADSGSYWPKVVREIVLTRTAQHNEAHQGSADRAPTPKDDIAALQNKHVMYVPDECRNPSREVKIQRDLLKDYFNHFGALDGQEDRMLMRDVVCTFLPVTEATDSGLKVLLGLMVKCSCL